MSEPGFTIEQKRKEGLLFVNLGIKVSWLLLFIALTASLAVFVWHLKLDRTLADLDEKFNSLERQRDKNLENEIVRLNEQLKQVTGLINSHPYWTKLFAKLEQNTLLRVQFDNFGAELDSYVISLAAKALDYKTVAEQLTVFDGIEEFENIESGDLTVTEKGAIDFPIKVNFSPVLLRE